MFDIKMKCAKLSFDHKDIHFFDYSWMEAKLTQPLRESCNLLQLAILVEVDIFLLFLNNNQFQV